WQARPGRGRSRAGTARPIESCSAECVAACGQRLTSTGQHRGATKREACRRATTYFACTCGIASANGRCFFTCGLAARGQCVTSARKRCGATKREACRAITRSACTCGIASANDRCFFTCGLATRGQCFTSTGKCRGATKREACRRATTYFACTCGIAIADGRCFFTRGIAFGVTGSLFRSLAPSTSLCAAQSESRFGHASLQIPLRETALRWRTISRCYYFARRGRAWGRLGNC